MAAKAKDTKKGKVEGEGLASILGGKGFEDATGDSYAIPFLRILQKGSPEVDEDDDAFIDGAKPGMIIHTVTQEVFDTVEFIPVKFTQTYIEWVPRNQGGGFRGEYALGAKVTEEMLASTEENEKRIPILPNGNEFKRHANYYGALKRAEEVYEPICISMASTQLTFSRKWMTQMKQTTLELGDQTVAGLNMDVFTWRLSTIRQENDQGTWYGWKAERVDHNLNLEDASNPLYLPAVQEQSTFITNAMSNNLLTLDRSQQQADSSEQDNTL